MLAGGPARVVRYGISDDEAADVGLTCGGRVHVFVHELAGAEREALEATAEAIAGGVPVALATLLDGEHAGAQMAVLPDAALGSLAATGLLDASVARDARGLLDEGRSDLRRYSGRGETMGSDLRVAIQAFASPPRMVIVGAIDFSAALAPLARDVGYEVTICDARAAFARSPRFTARAEVVVDWPDRHLDARELGPRDAVLVFSHDPKFDEPALLAALRSGAGYIGALGSRRTHADRCRRLSDAGATDADLARIASPCGLDIGARSPSETAVAILAEILARRSGRSARPLAETRGPIHARPAGVAAR